MPPATPTFICPVATGSLATPSPVCPPPYPPSLPHPFNGVRRSGPLLRIDRVCGKEVFPISSWIPSLVLLGLCASSQSTVHLGLWVKGAGGWEHSRTRCGWREQGAPLLLPPPQVNPDTLPPSVSCNHSLCLICSSRGRRRRGKGTSSPGRPMVSWSEEGAGRSGTPSREPLFYVRLLSRGVGETQGQDEVGEPILASRFVYAF